MQAQGDLSELQRRAFVPSTHIWSVRRLFYHCFQILARHELREAGPALPLGLDLAAAAAVPVGPHGLHDELVLGRLHRYTLTVQPPESRASPGPTPPPAASAPPAATGSEAAPIAAAAAAAAAAATASAAAAAAAAGAAAAATVAAHEYGRGGPVVRVEACQDALFETASARSLGVGVGLGAALRPPPRQRKSERFQVGPRTKRQTKRKLRK